VTIRVVVVDDQTLVRSGFRSILSAEDDIEVVGEAADGMQAIEICRQTSPDVVLMDIRMPVMDGVEATRRLTQAHASHARRVLMLTTFDLDELVHAAIHAGASGFLLKDAPPDELMRAIRVVAAGEAQLAPSVTRRLISYVAALEPTVASSPRAREAVERLTERERDVLKLIARGLSNTEIADQVFVAETTVKTHIGRIFMKLEARDRVQAAVIAYDAGLVLPGTD
jgi:DNA-binding NarL/FixJ family response regulator